MTILTVNAGSSSLRLGLFARDDGRQIASHRYRDYPNDTALSDFLGAYASSTVAAVAHRVVHGGERFTAPCRIDARTENEIELLVPLAPLHNPAALRWIRAARALLGAHVPQVAVFDTAFFRELPAIARQYALPLSLTNRHGARRYGFHGLAHEAMWQRWEEISGHSPRDKRAISIQLGSGCSITAIYGGRAVDTSMGFTPLEGLVMATRSGDVDPGLLMYLQRAEGIGPEQMERVLSEQSGLAGLSGESGDMQVLLESRLPEARLAVDVYCYRVRKYIGAYMAALGGVDAILFGGGVGEMAAVVRERILAGLEPLGIVLDTEANRAIKGIEGRISQPHSPIEMWVIVVDESRALVRAGQAVLSEMPAPPRAA